MGTSGKGIVDCNWGPADDGIHSDVSGPAGRDPYVRTGDRVADWASWLSGWWSMSSFFFFFLSWEEELRHWRFLVQCEMVSCCLHCIRKYCACEEKGNEPARFGEILVGSWVFVACAMGDDDLA